MFRQIAFLFFSFCFTVLSYGQSRKSMDSIVVPTSLKYKNPSLFKRIFLGKNYRPEWQTPVKVPVFKFSDWGFKIKELGGGQQTKSLQLEDKNGKSWALRSVDKEVTMEALPKGLKLQFVRNIVQDMVSGAHPHAPMAVSELSKAIGVIAPDPVMYYIADDEGLNPYKHLFVGTLCFLEEREPTRDGGDTKNTENLLEDLTEENDHLIAQKYLLKARLLDMLIADWDRHADQWRWAERDSADANFYYAIPRDRDQAFYFSNGLLIKAARLFGLKHLVGFTHKTNKLRKLNFKEWNFDRSFLNELERNEWLELFQQFKSNLTDEVIIRAAKKLPPETYAIRGKLVEEKLLARRDDMQDDVMNYYGFLSTIVAVNGSDEDEIFTVTKSGDRLNVKVMNASGKRVIYERSFDEAETKQIELNGLKGKDKFILEEGVASRINIIFDGGEGEDSYDIKGEVKNKIIDSASEKNEFIRTSRSKKELK
jgi:hypothetical protein